MFIEHNADYTMFMTQGFRLFSHDITVAIFVYKTMNLGGHACVPKKKNPLGIELFSHVKFFFYSKQFAKLLTT